MSASTVKNETSASKTNQYTVAAPSIFIEGIDDIES